MTPNLRRYFPSIVTVGLLLATRGVLTHTFEVDLRAARARLDAYDERLADTPCGRIAYVEAGSGEPVLGIHGNVGGYDHGLSLIDGFIGSDHRLIAPSRFGYPGTPMPEDPTVEAQADAHVCLLDALGVDRAVVVATSAGATSALQLALRHPERVSALVLISPNAPGKVEVALPPKPVLSVIFGSDLAYWLFGKAFPSQLTGLMGVPEGFAQRPEFQDIINDVRASTQPISTRTLGALFDTYVSNPSINDGLPLHDITTPTLVVAAKDDPLCLYANTSALARVIPSAQLLTVADGGHMLLGHGDAVRADIRRFLTATAAVSR